MISNSDITKEDRIWSSFYQALDPPPDYTVDEWADKYRFLSSEASSEPGPWRTERFPYLREIMRVLSPQDPTEEVVLMSGAQVGKTEICLNVMGYSIHWDPCPMLYIQKTVDSVIRFSRQRFESSLEMSPEIRNKLSPSRSRDGANTITLKTFPGGALVLGGANSAASLRSMPIKKLMLDEEETYDADIQEEGDPIELAIRRTANFPGRKIFHLSTPTVKETSKIEPLFLEGDQRYYHVPCPFCDQYQIIRWPNIIFEVEQIGVSYKIKSVYLKCEKCGEGIAERYKTQMLDRGKWVAENPGADIASFHINSLYSPLGFFSWKDAVRLWMKYKRSKDAAHLKVFVNTVLGETFSESNKHVDFSTLQSHKEIYPAEVPEKVKLLVAGVDVQEDRIEVEVLGVGNDLETWSIDYQRFYGDIEMDFVWGQLDQFLMKSWKHESGADMYLLGAAIDSGHKAKLVYDFVGPREHRRIFAIKGRAGWGQGLINRPNRRLSEGPWLHIVFVDEMKSKVYSVLKITNPGPGYCHFPDRPEYDENYFRMLTSERLETRRVKGHAVLDWVLGAGKRNEALDCRVYALAILYMMYPKIEMVNQLPGIVSIAPGTGAGVRRKRKLRSKGLE